MKCYYAHCQSIYDTPQEKRDIEILEALGFEVINPNLPEHQKECKTFHNPMAYFERLAKSCNVLAFRALQDGNIGAGVVQEIKCFEGLIIELPSRILQRGLTVEQTREYLREVGQR